jgi:hypothetical protein
MAGDDLTDDLTEDPSLHALGRSMRATFSYHDLWPHLLEVDRVEYLGYALTQRNWLSCNGFYLTTGCTTCPLNPALLRADAIAPPPPTSDRRTA